MAIHHSNPFRVNRIIRDTPFFAALTEEELTKLSKVVQERRFSKNEVILLEEDTHNFMYIVFSGKVKAVQTSADGKEHILAIRGEGEFFGEMGIIDGKTSPATVIAIENSEIGLISREDFHSQLLSSEAVTRELILMLCTRLREAWLKLKVLTLSEAEQRVRAVLRLLSEQYGMTNDEGTLIEIKLTHRDIAEYVSLSRETVTRQLDKLVKGEEIQILKNRLILLKPDFFKKMLVL